MYYASVFLKVLIHSKLWLWGDIFDKCIPVFSFPYIWMYTYADSYRGYTEVTTDAFKCSQANFNTIKKMCYINTAFDSTMHLLVTFD